jgi:hypothetical protein
MNKLKMKLATDDGEGDEGDLISNPNYQTLA